MKTIEKYVFSSFLTSFLLAFLVLSFVLTIGLLVQIVGLILDGVSSSLVWEFAMVSFPETMQWTIPLALLVSSVLVFSRLSADSEVAAMRACGINLLAVMKWPVLFGLVCSLTGMYINNEIVPRGHEVRRNLKSSVTVSSGLSALQPGVWIDDFPKVKVYFGRKEGHTLYDLIVLDNSNKKIDRMFRANKAIVTEQGRDISLDLFGLTVDPLDEDHPGVARMSRYPYVMKDALKESSYTRKGKDFNFRELVAKIGLMKDEEQRALDRLVEMKKAAAPEGTEVMLDDKEVRSVRREMKRNRSKMKVELSKRFVFAMASLCFVLVGIPLGIRAQRKESSIGMAISLAIAMGYYLVVLLMISLQKTYSIHPEFLIWLPVVTCFALAARFTRKNL